jgi:hypothetical protein
VSRLPGAGETFGRYVLERKLGQGGMGLVYAAHDTVLNRKVALKLVAPHLAEDPEFGVRFAREAETQARLDSPHVVRINDYGEHDGVLFLSTQLVDGADLASRVMTGGALLPGEAVDVTLQVLEGLQDAHRAGVVHRDVKPANVLLGRRNGALAAYLCDFGIATTAGQGVTRTGQVIGSLPWMAPERHYGQDSGAPGDVYSAGCLFWFALTGAAPYVGSDGEVMRGQLDGLVPQLVGETPFARRANAVLGRALAKEPVDRYATAEAMAADLRQLVTVAPATVQVADAAPTTLRSAATRPAPLPTRSPRRPWALPVLATACLLAAVAGGLGVRALASDDPALAAGVTTVEVAGRTVTVQPTRTLTPIAGARKGASAVIADEGITAGLPGPGGGVDGLGVPTAAARPGASGAGTTARATTAASAGPRYAYRCWDSASHLTNDLSSCGVPSGVAGVRWVYRAYGDRCYALNAGDGRVQQAYQCWIGDVHLNLYRFASASNARGFLDGFLTSGAAWSEWSTAGSWAGYRRAGEAVGQDRPYRQVFYYSPAGEVWGAVVAAQTASARGSVVSGSVQRYFRSLPTIRGERL